ncbi:hypothetical protein TorRG33x02_117760, partial [Trema orientale]
SKIFDQVEKIKSDGGSTGKTAGYVRLELKNFNHGQTLVECRSKISTGGFDSSRIVRLRSNGGSTPVENVRPRSKFSGDRLKNDRNNRERRSDKFDHSKKFSTLVERRRRRWGRNRDR